MGRQLGILNVGGHPKDAIMYAGGSMAIHVARGDRVCALTPTNGLHHHQVAAQEYRPGGKVDVGAYVEERRQELIAAAKELGVTDVRFLGHDDEILFIDREIVSEIADVVGEVRPDIVVTHHPHDSYAAHAYTGQMTLLAMDTASGIRVGRPYAPHGVKQVFFRGILKKCVNSQAVYPLSEQHGREAQERR